MTYAMHRVFCATPGDLEPERQAFHEVIGQVNETEGMPENVLLVPVSIVPNMLNKTIFQPLVDANVRECSFFVLVLHITWGPPTKNFESEFNLARSLKADPASLMKGISVFFKATDGLEIEPEVQRLKSALHSPAQPGAGFATHKLAAPQLATPQLATPQLATPQLATHDFATLDDYKQELQAQLSSWLRTVTDNMTA